MINIKDKLNSRKFIVWVTSTVFVLLSFIAFVMTNNSALEDIMRIFADGWVWISSIYIGVNGISKFANKGVNNDQDIIMR